MRGNRHPLTPPPRVPPDTVHTGDLAELQELWRECYRTGEDDLQALLKTRNNWADFSVVHRTSPCK